MSRERPTAGDRVVQAALARVHERGIAVGLDGISLEEAIAASGVSRATAYRHWPSRVEFLRAVLVRVVHDARLEPEGSEELDALRAFVEAHRPLLRTEAGRRTIVVECLRISADADFRRLAASREWRDYLALTATCQSLAEGDLRSTVTAELAAAERSFVRHRAEVYARLPGLLGYRLVAPLFGTHGFEVMSEAVGALMTGFIVHATVAGDATPYRARAFGSTMESEWTRISYGLVAALLAYLEPDPAVVWSRERIAESVDTFREISQMVEATRGSAR